MKNILKVLALLIIALVVVYLLGPKPPKPALEMSLAQMPAQLLDVESLIEEKESQIAIKPDNESRIVWADSLPQKTAYTVVYLPGFTATYMEGEPVHRHFAARYGYNLYLPRLSEYGLATDAPMIDFSVDRLLASACEAVAVGLAIGDEVILMGSSTGVTLALLLAEKFPEKIAAVIAYSPNIEVENATAKLLTKPWGLQIARMFVGGKFRGFEESDTYKKYWYTHYRLEGLIGMQSLLDASMKPALFTRVKQPFFMGYYYKDEEQKDQVVSVSAMLKMFDQLGTPEEQKRKVAFPNVGRHELASGLVSKDIESVEKATYQFAEEILGLKPEQQ
jgi:pimeloyl-ACP methyl ester carboxylesterase